MTRTIITPTATPMPIPAFAPLERVLFEGEILAGSVGVAVLAPGLVSVLLADEVGDVVVGVVKSSDCQRIEMPFAFIPTAPDWLVTVPRAVKV